MQKERARRVSGSHVTLSRARVQDAPDIYLGRRCLKNVAGKGCSGTGGWQHTSEASHCNQGRWKLCFMSSVSVMLSQVQGTACETHYIMLPSGRLSTRILLKCSSSLSCCLLKMYRGPISLCVVITGSSLLATQGKIIMKMSARTLFLEPDAWMSEEGSVA